MFCRALLYHCIYFGKGLCFCSRHSGLYLIDKEELTFDSAEDESIGLTGQGSLRDPIWLELERLVHSFCDLSGPLALHRQRSDLAAYFFLLLDNVDDEDACVPGQNYQVFVRVESYHQPVVIVWTQGRNLEKLIEKLHVRL